MITGPFSTSNDFLNYFFLEFVPDRCMFGDPDFVPSPVGSLPCPDLVAQLEQALAALGREFSDDALAVIGANATRYRESFASTAQRLEREEDSKARPIDDLRWGLSAIGFAVNCAARSSNVNSVNELVNQLRGALIGRCGDCLEFIEQQRWLAELPLTLAFLLDGVAPTEALIESGLTTMNDLIASTLDTDGWPSADVLDDFGELATSWLSCRQIADALGNERVGNDSATGICDPSVEAVQEAIEGMPRQLMRLLRGDRSLMMTERNQRITEDMLAALIESSTESVDALIYERTGKYPIKPRPNHVDLDRSRNSISRWGNNFLFHDGWERKACKVAAIFDAFGCRLEICKKKTLIFGDAFPEVSFLGQTLAIEDEPEILVSLTNDQIAFVEIQWTLTGGVVLQRHIALSMEDKCAWVGDVLLPPDHSESSSEGGGGEFQYRCRWPLGAGITTVSEYETTEGYLFDGKKIRAMVIPPALSEWQVETSRRSGVGKLELDKTSFTIHQSGVGKAMYVPLFFDLSPRRCKRPRTWRQLTVAEKLTIVPNDVAVAYRVQVGKKQFVLYRSLGKPASRTFLGQNVNKELFFGRLEKDRSMTELLQVE